MIEIKSIQHKNDSKNNKMVAMFDLVDSETNVKSIYAITYHQDEFIPVQKIGYGKQSMTPQYPIKIIFQVVENIIRGQEAQWNIISEYNEQCRLVVKITKNIYCGAYQIDF